MLGILFFVNLIKCFVFVVKVYNFGLIYQVLLHLLHYHHPVCYVLLSGHWSPPGTLTMSLNRHLTRRCGEQILLLPWECVSGP